MLHTADASTVRRHNSSVLLGLIWSSQGISRADLARASGLSRSTVSSIVNELIDAGVLRESPSEASGVGRPPVLLDFCVERFLLVGIDMGSSHLAVGVTDLRGNIRAIARADCDVQGDAPSTLRLMRQQVDRCLAEADAPGAHVLGIGLSVPCPVDLADPDALSPRILPGWADIRPAEMLRYNYGVPVFTDNDANLGALAEKWWGAGRDVGDFAYIKVATGVGAGHIIDGRIYRGAGGIAGEIGHTAVDAHGPRCRCGLNGCLEAMIGAPAVARSVRALLASGRTSVLDPSDLSPAAIATAAHAGDPVALEVVQEAGRYLGIAVANLLNLLNPSTVILGGSLTQANDLLLIPLRRTVRDRALWNSIAGADVVLSPLGQNAVLLGAAGRVLQSALDDPDLFPTTRNSAVQPAPAPPRRI